MGASAVCLDQNQNSVSCVDPNCTYGDCGSTSTQVISGSLCLDQDQNAVACSDPNCTYGDCTPSAVGQIGAAAASTQDGGTTLTTPHTGGAVGGTGSTQTLLQALTAGANAATSVITAPPKTSLTLGSSGLSISSAGSLFSNPLMLLLLAVITALVFGLWRKRS